MPHHIRMIDPQLRQNCPHIPRLRFLVISTPLDATKAPSPRKSGTHSPYDPRANSAASGAYMSPCIPKPP